MARMNHKEQKPSDMDIHFKDGVIRCKYCKQTERTTWPVMLLDFPLIQEAINAFAIKHTMCSWKANGYVSES